MEFGRLLLDHDFYSQKTSDLFLSLSLPVAAIGTLPYVCSCFYFMEDEYSIRKQDDAIYETSSFAFQTIVIFFFFSQLPKFWSSTDNFVVVGIFLLRTSICT